MKRLITAATAASALLLAGCGSGEPAPTVTPAASSAAAAYPVTVGTVTLTARPEKIVSLSPTATEMLFAIGAGPQVIAVDDQSTYPAEAPKTDLSGFKPNVEAIVAKDPDLVVVYGDADGIVAQLGKLAIPVLVSPAAATLDGTFTEITELGTLTGHRDEATALNTKMAAEIDTIVKSVPARSRPLSYYYELSPDLYSATSKTFIGSIFDRFGMTNVADAADPDGKLGGYPKLSQESLVKANPDTIFLADTKCCQQTPETVRARAGWSSMTAVTKGQIYALDDDIASRWGPRTVELVEAVADAVAKVPA
ncbi:ABC transporter substrate-binding protein [Actinoplanes xinjiangensis]|jgi:iron complex transport system substrate-binding protein|uniref:Iron complex transport system substrate-binding protein n=1 Tax=Actinoplanes xinjiangensis TaxID=512350 RepID=A0A316F7V1_9ACTN|nr:ABC transporter substrate-binding protein [Actinoplanes xinjiangensis]PWK41609.1 iron complex transport system substrate-binding protein [Actinoplanes xinjiangensis]GIF41987.1 ABC transporter substrate-binding protein [Actinoplanes xinjiangensis]